MEHTTLKLDIKYHITRKDGNKEVCQRFVKLEKYFPEVTAQQIAGSIAFVEAATDIMELMPDN